MKKPIPKIRVFGQRSIVPSLLKGSSIPRVEESWSKKEDKCASFSEFLDSKLNKSVLFKPNNTEKQEGPRLFTSLDASKDLSQEKKNKNGNGGLEKTMLRQFKPRETQPHISQGEMSRDVTGKASVEPLDQTTAEEVTEINEDIIIVKDDRLSKERRDPFAGMENMNRTRKPVLVFGEDNSKVSKPMQEEGERAIKKPKPATYNHYANGSGFWDCDMEGVDSEEVGHSEVWEGVGSTTFGDIVDWH